MTIKKFPTYTKHGLGISETGKLMIPYVAKSDYAKAGMNLYGQPLVNLGDYACTCSHNGLITKKNIGKVAKQEHIAHFGEITEVKREDGTLDDTGMWTYTVYAMSKNEYEDALTYYKIKV